MTRLTTNKDVKDMTMYELAHNSCYAKNGNARYRDYEADMDARHLVIQLLKKFTDDDTAFEGDEHFDECMYDYLQYGFDTLESLIAVFYHSLWTKANLRETLKKYEDLEEQGLLFKLPIAIGSDIYFIPSEVNYKLNVLHKQEEKNRVYHQKVARITLNKYGWYIECDKNFEYGVEQIFVEKTYKVTWFTDKTEAEQALKRMKEGD